MKKQRKRISQRELQQLYKRSEELHKRDKAYLKKSNVDFFVYIVAVVLIALSIRLFIFEPIRVDGASMEPTLWHNERLFVEKVGYWFDTPKRGDVIICYYPDEVQTCVKRVIGEPGDTVAVVFGVVYVNGEPIDESAYWQGRIDGSMSEVNVPDDCVFVMGDNRNWSKDSRSESVGPIPLSRIVGHARSVIWPLDARREL